MITASDRALVMRIAHSEVWSTRCDWGQDWSKRGPGYGRVRKGADRQKHRMQAFSDAMRKAWAQVKDMAAKRAERIANQSTARPLADIKYAMTLLENKDHWTQADYQRMDTLRKEAQVWA